VQLAVVKIEYLADSSLQQDAREFFLDSKKDSDGIPPHGEGPSKKHLEYIKPEIKSNISEVQDHMKEAHIRGPEITHMYEMRSRRSRMLDDHNKFIMDEEERLKENGKK
jgi:hypothetical protein